MQKTGMTVIALAAVVSMSSMVNGNAQMMADAPADVGISQVESLDTLIADLEPMIKAGQHDAVVEMIEAKSFLAKGKDEQGKLQNLKMDAMLRAGRAQEAVENVLAFTRQSDDSYGNSKLLRGLFNKLLKNKNTDLAETVLAEYINHDEGKDAAEMTLAFAKAQSSEEALFDRLNGRAVEELTAVELLTLALLCADKEEHNAMRVTVLNRLVELAPEDQDAQMLLMDAHLAEGNVAVALELFHTRTKMDPYGFYKETGKLIPKLVARGRSEEAAALALKIGGSDSSAKVEMWRVERLIDAQAYDSAMARLDELETQASPDMQMYDISVMRVAALKKSGKLDQALRELDKMAGMVAEGEVKRQDWISNERNAIMKSMDAEAE